MKLLVIHQKAFVNKACLSGRESAHIMHGNKWRKTQELAQ